jgi:hypothetical protein
MRLRLIAGLAPLLLAGCVGSDVAYLPYDDEHDTREERPDPTKRADEEETLALKNAVPVEIDRTDALYQQGRKALGRIMGSIPKNPWNEYRRDLIATIGPDEAVKYYPVDPVKPAGAAPAEKPAEAEEAPAEE